MSARGTWIWIASFGIAFLGAGQLLAAEKLTAEEAKSLARDLYYYAYPLMSMDVTMQQSTNVPSAGTVPMRAPVNQFAHAREYPNANSREVVRFNFDTLYSLAWVDVSAEPMVLNVPDTHGRYYLLEMLDMWSDVFCVVGSRTTGDGAGEFVLVAPDWKGTLPKGATKIVAPTPMFWILGRTQTNGPSDYANVHKVQDGYKLTPLSRQGHDYKPPTNVATDNSIDDKTPPQKQVNSMDGVTMLTRLAALMAKYPPHANDYPILFRMRALGIAPGERFDPSKLDSQIVNAINAGAQEALVAMPGDLENIGQRENGWTITTENIGTYGTSYKQRALIALGGLGANLPEDAIYPTAFVDAKGQPLDGGQKYTVHFDKGELPPANAFWSITMYDKEGFQIANPINRFAIGDRDKLKFGDDGSLTIYIQPESPGSEREANWLPSPKEGTFQPTMRIYSPRASVTDGSWKPPGIQRSR
jgi:hypothetical protein